MLVIDNVFKTYKVGTFGGQDLQACTDVCFTVGPGEIVALIGESGSGKSTIGKMVLNLVSTTSGSITWKGRPVSGQSRRQLRDYYREVQGVFQDPFSSFNPIFKVDRTFDTLRQSFFGEVDDATWEARLHTAIREVSLEPAEMLGKFPHQLSGGQLQRLLIARALLLDIDLLVADEVISMLDASTRIDILNLLADLRERGLGILFVTHDLSLGHYISDRTVILLDGHVVEKGDTPTVFANPLHPYTRRLMAAVPHLDRKWSEVEREFVARDAELAGTCPVHQRATATAEAAEAPAPVMVEVEPGHEVACFAVGSDEPCPVAQRAATGPAREVA